MWCMWPYTFECVCVHGQVCKPARILVGEHQNTNIGFFSLCFSVVFKFSAEPIYGFTIGKKKVLENQPQFFHHNISPVFIFFFTSLFMYKNVTQGSAPGPWFSDSTPRESANSSHHVWQLLCSTAPWLRSAPWSCVCTCCFHLSSHQSEHKLRPRPSVP